MQDLVFRGCWVDDGQTMPATPNGRGIQPLASKPQCSFHRKRGKGAPRRGLVRALPLGSEERQRERERERARESEGGGGGGERQREKRHTHT